MTFSEAITLVYSGKKVERQGVQVFLGDGTFGPANQAAEKRGATIQGFHATKEDIEATDWLEVTV